MFNFISKFFEKVEETELSINRRTFIIGAGLGVGSLLLPKNVEKLIANPRSNSQLTNLNVIAVQLERIRPKLSKLFEEDEVLWNMIESKKIEEVNKRTVRMPFKILSAV